MLADIDECVDENGDEECEEKDATCVNQEGGYICECEEGFRFNAAGICEGKRLATMLN